MVVRCVWDAEVQGSNPCTPTNLKLLPVELALGLRNRVAKVRFLPRVPLYGVCSIMVVPKVVDLESAGSTPVIHPKHRKIARVVDRSSLLRSRTVRFRGFESHIFLQYLSVAERLCNGLQIRLCWFESSR